MSHRISIGSLKLLLFLLILIGFAGCTRHWVVEQYPMKDGMVPNFVGQQPVNIINAQYSTEEVIIAEMGHWTHMANLRKWTDTAIKVLETELHQRNIATTTEAEKNIKLAITRVNLDCRWSCECKVDLKVETGDGYTAVFTRVKQTPNFYHACGRAVLWAVAATLNDDTILAYLKL